MSSTAVSPLPEPCRGQTKQPDDQLRAERAANGRFMERLTSTMTRAAKGIDVVAKVLLAVVHQAKCLLNSLAYPPVTRYLFVFTSREGYYPTDSCTAGNTQRCSRVIVMKL